VVAKVGAPHGVRGDLKLQALSENPSAHLKLAQSGFFAFDQKPFGPAAAFTLKPHGDQYVIHFVGCDNREDARRYTHGLLGIDKKHLPVTANNEYYWADLEGLSVVTLAGDVLGEVDHLMETGSNDVLVIKGDTERLLPFIDDVIQDVDFDAGVISVDWQLDW
jgi:16S rRNA processing protein RimM